MKKVIALLVMAILLGTVASVAFARTLEEERDAVRAYLKVVDAKIIRFRKQGNKTMEKKMQAEKQATLARWEKLKAQMERAQAAPPPPPVAPVPPPRPVVVRPAAPAGLFGWGLNTALAGGYINTGRGQLSGSAVLKGDVILEDFVGLGPMVGLSADAIQYKVGLGAVYGGGGMKAIPLNLGGVINLPKDWMGGLETYLVGGLNYVVYGNGQTSGKEGGDAGVGIKADLGLGLGKTGFELGYTIVRSKTVSSKGVSLTVSQPILL